ncbi:MAG: nucleoside triphosphate pyrophosphohydrolase [Clostridiaceae bacterium]|jgi:predicted house-cleaning noncanonical NTP pyrophosphatase (MazG superfamily)|nr:nucleoside triphosphate pyrophosphohydrolase [Clostridiaceae bacterium]
MNVTKYNKLVRDKIPEIIEKSGRKAITEKVSEEAYYMLLNEKLDEERKEYLESLRVEELADLVEVIYAILEYKKVPIEDFEAMRIEKAAKRGAFKERILLKEVIEG